MTKTKTTKRALIASVLSLLVCVSMLIGSTFAWFTDTATTGVNTIKSGNLDIKVSYKNSTVTSWTEVSASSKLFDDAALWEPGYTEVAYLKVENNGSLALKYDLTVNVINEVVGKSVLGNDIELSTVLKYDLVELASDTTYADREKALAAVSDAKNLATEVVSGNMEANADATKYFALIVYMPTDVGNAANHNGTDIPSIQLGVTVVATQYTSESDSFNNQYDAAAPYLEDEDGTILISDAASLLYFAKQVNVEKNSFLGKTVELTANIDLAGFNWTPIGSTGSTTFSGSFDGKGYTISNLDVDTTAMGRKDAAAAGLFGWIENHSTENPTTIKNLKLNNVTVASGKHAGAVAGYISGGAVIDNCDITNAVISGTRAAAVVGYQNDGDTIKNCDVTNATIKGSESYGEFCGYTYGTVENCTATGITFAIAVDTQDEFNAAVDAATASNAIEIVLAEGTYLGHQRNIVNKNITFTGTKASVIDMTQLQINYVNMTGSTLTFDGVTVKWYEGEQYQGLKNPAFVTYSDCDINGLQYLYGDAKFVDCTFTNKTGWSVILYSEVDATFSNCIFNTGNHAVLLYMENGITGQVSNATLTNCIFNNDGTQEEPWGVEQLVECADNVHNGSNVTYNITFSNCTVNNTGSVTKNLWGNKNSMPASRLSITVDGVAQDVSKHPTANQ